MIRWRRSTTLLCHPELEGARSAGTKAVSITAGICTTSPFLFGGPCERSTPFPLRPYEFAIFRTAEIPFARCSHKYFSLNFSSHKTCYKFFAIPIAYRGYDGCPSHHRFPQAKLIFPLDLPKKHQPLSFLVTISLEFPVSSLIPFSTFSQMFLLLHFLLLQKLLEGFWRDSSDSSIRTLPISWPLNNSLLSFLEHVSVFSTQNWGWNMQRHLETCLTRFIFSLTSSILIIMTFVHIHTPTSLLPKKTIANKY